MADMFNQMEAKQLFKDKKIYLFGDSNMRALYKDLICLMHKGTLIENADLRGKMEHSYLKDQLIKKSRLHSGRDFTEERLYAVGHIHLSYKFITRCWCDTIEKFLDDCERNIIQPNVIVMNSCLWDITRWGADGVNDYKDNMLKLLKRLRKVLPKQCIFIWTTTMPVAAKCRAPFLVQQVDFLKHSLHFDVMEANVLVKDLVASHGFDVLDVYHYLRMQTMLRARDGVHWNPIAVRLISNLVLTHVCLSWDIELPGRINNSALASNINMSNIPAITPTIELPVNIHDPKPEQSSKKQEVKVRSSASRVDRNKPYSRNNNHYGRNSRANKDEDFSEDVTEENFYNHRQTNRNENNCNNYDNYGPMRQNRRRNRWY